jgi:methionine synthase I (cobalamin-dependent)
MAITKAAFLRRRWVADGAMATRLFALGAEVGLPVEALNESMPALVRDVHCAAMSAGAQIVRTNTFRRHAANAAGVRIARAVAQDHALVAGAIGPTGVHVAPLGNLSFEQARDHFRQHAVALRGVDLYTLETFRDLNELRAAVDGVRAAAGPEAIIAAHVTVERNGRLYDGSSPERLAEALNEVDADSVGVNCSFGCYPTLMAIETLAPLCRKPLSAFPSVGAQATVEYVADCARELLDLGVTMLGTCCGSGPEHTQAIRQACDTHVQRTFRPTIVGGEARADDLTWVPTTGRSAPQLAADLLALHGRGARRIVCTGPGLVAAEGLAYIARGLNRGIDIAGNRQEIRTNFEIGLLTTASDFSHADFAVAAPFEGIAPCPVPVVCAVWALDEVRTALYARHELGLAITDGMIERIARGEGRALAQEMLAAAQSATLVTQWPPT